jgi:CHAT domain-containing protein
LLLGLLVFGAPSNVLAATDLATPISVKTLLGESCATRVSEAAPLARVLPSDIMLQCAGIESGSLTFALIAAQSDNLADTFALSRQRNLIDKRLECEPGRLVKDGAFDVLTLACRQRSDGWPIVVMARVEGTVLRVAEGSASAYPALRSLLGLSALTGSDTEQANHVRALWSLPIKIGSGADQSVISAMLRQARIASSQSDYSAAEAGFRRALESQIRVFGEDDLATNDILMDLAMSVSAQGRHDEAEALLNRAALIVEKSPKAADRARLTAYRAFIAANKRDYDAALVQARASTAQWRDIAAQATSTGAMPGMPSAGGASEAVAELSMALNLEASMLLRTGDVTSAYASVVEAMLGIKKAEGEPRWWEADILVTLGNVSSAQGRLSAAEAYLKRALAIRQQVFGEGVATLQARVALARAYQSEHMSVSAIIVFREAMAVARKLPKASVPFSAEDIIPFFDAVAEEAARYEHPKERLGLYAEVFDAVQLARSPLFDQSMALTSARRSASDPELVALLRQLETATQKERELRVQLATEQSLLVQERSAAAEDQYSADIAAQGKAIADLRLDLAKRFPNFASMTDVVVPKLDDVRSRLRQDEGLLSFVIGRDRSFAQLMTKDGISLVAIPAGEAPLQEAVARLRRGLEIQGRSVNDFDLEAAHDLYTTLFGGLTGDLAQIKRLIVVPSGPLANLPFALLVTRPPLVNQYNSAHWLVKDLNVSYSPTIASFVALRATRLTGSHARTLLAFGNPVLASPSTVRQVAPVNVKLGDDCGANGIVPASLLRSLSSLPDTVREIGEVARILRADKKDVLLGAQANEAAFRDRNLADYRILYFATHGLLPSELKCQAQPGVVLTPPKDAPKTAAFDGLLDASEISSLSIPADLVVLSACNTAGSGKANGGESLSGLAAAFFQAGARSMVVSHWQVPSAATSALMSEMFNVMGTSKATPVDEALGAAQARLFNNPATAHPFFWAAFVVMGDGLTTPLSEGVRQ